MIGDVVDVKVKEKEELQQQQQQLLGTTIIQQKNGRMCRGAVKNIPNAIYYLFPVL